MTTFVIFWAALLAIFFFIAGTLFKALASAFYALMSFIGKMIIFLILGTVVLFSVSGIYMFIDAVIKGGFGNFIEGAVISVVVLGILIAIFGGIGAVVLDIAISTADLVIRAASFILEGAAGVFERGYAKFLTVIIKRIEKC